MKILKTSALAVILALGSLSANATSYSGTATLTLEFNMADAITVALADSTMTFSNLVPGDSINATQVVTITAETTFGNTSTRAITCTVGGTASTSAHTELLKGDDGTTTISTISYSLGTCANGTNTLTITGTILDNAQVLPGDTYSPADVDIVVSYTAATVGTYS